MAPLRPRRKVTLLLHILAAGTWFGLDAAMAILVFTSTSTDDPGTQAYALQALQLVTVWPMFTAAVLSLATGVLLGLGSKYGPVRYWWVLVKLCLNLLLMVLVLLALPTGVDEAARIGGLLAAGQDVAWRVQEMIFPPIVSPTLLLVAFVLSIFKPWGRVRKRAT